MTRDFKDRAAQVKARVYEAGLTQAEVARRLGRGDEVGRVYVRSILNATRTSNPLLDEVERVVDEHIAQAA